MAPRRLILLVVLGALPVFTAARGVFAQARADSEAPNARSETQPTGFVRRELPTPRVRATILEDSLNPFRQSVFIFDQSITTQTASLGPLPQSYVPLYEVWLSLRPRYYFDEHWSLRGRFDYTKELTNNQATTHYREDVLGDIWTDLVYSTTLDRWWQDTKVNIGLRALWPTAKASQGDGDYVTLGVLGRAEHKFQIRGEEASSLNFLRVDLGLVYLHPWSAATTSTNYGGFAYRRQNVDGFSFISDELSGQTLPEHVVWSIFEAVLQMTPRLSLSGDFITINEWHYAPTGNVRVPIAGGTATVAPPRNDNQFTESTWLVANVDYALFDELDLSVGYYNLTNAVAADGQTRSVFGSDTIWWSPDARLFFDVTWNLDVLWDDAHKGAARAQAARAGRIASHLR